MHANAMSLKKELDAFLLLKLIRLRGGFPLFHMVLFLFYFCFFSFLDHVLLRK